MSENPGFEDETDFGGFGEKRESVTSRKSAVSQSEIKIEDEKIFTPEDDVIPEPYAGMPAEVLLHHSRKRGWVIGRAIGWLGRFLKRRADWLSRDWLSRDWLSQEHQFENLFQWSFALLDP